MSFKSKRVVFFCETAKRPVIRTLEALNLVKTQGNGIGRGMGGRGYEGFRRKLGGSGYKTSCASLDFIFVQYFRTGHAQA